MTAPMQDQLEAAMARLRQQREKIREFQSAMEERTVSVTSKNRMVSATVDSRGRLTALSFKGNRYRSLPPAELGALVVETVSQAQETAAKQALEAASSIMPSGLPGMSSGSFDLDEMTAAAEKLMGQPLFSEDLAETIRTKGGNSG
jgi:DNA-binding protein YbaB